MKNIDDVYIVTEIINGEKIEVSLTREQAEKLYRKIRSVGGIADIKKSVSKVKGL